MELSWIQQHVLFVLVRNKVATVKELQPNAIEANLFSYHLNGLVKQGYVEKVARGTYTLTDMGEKYVGALSTSTKRITENIKTVILLWAERDGKVLLFRWSRQPYINQVTLPYDRMPIGKKLEDGLLDALNDKLGVSDVSTEYVASALIQIKKADTVISHMNALVYKAETDKLEDGFIARNGLTFWSGDQDTGQMNGVDDFLQKLRAGDRLIESIWSYEE